MTSTHTTECGWASRKNEVLACRAARGNLKDVLLRETSQLQKEQHCTSPLTRRTEQSDLRGPEVAVGLGGRAGTPCAPRNAPALRDERVLNRFWVVMSHSMDVLTATKPHTETRLKQILCHVYSTTSLENEVFVFFFF